LSHKEAQKEVATKRHKRHIKKSKNAFKAVRL